MWHIYTWNTTRLEREMEKKFSDKWMKLGYILSKVAYTQKDKYCVSSHLRLLTPNPQLRVFNIEELWKPEQ